MDKDIDKNTEFVEGAILRRLWKTPEHRQIRDPGVLRVRVHGCRLSLGFLLDASDSEYTSIVV